MCLYKISLIKEYVSDRQITSNAISEVKTI